MEYGAVGGLLLAVLRWVEYRYLVLQHSFEIYGGLVADPITLPMTRSDIADYLGLTIETVSRTFSSLKKKGLIELEDTTHVHLVDRDRLEDLAAGFA